MQKVLGYHSWRCLLFVFAVAVSILVTNLLFPHNYPLFLNSAKAQEVSLRNGYSKITLPDVGEQNDSWSCAPNSAARVLKFYGYRVSYGVMKGHIKYAQNIPGFESFGTTPSELRNAMQKYANDVRLEREASFDDLIGLVSRGIPVITLVRVGSFKPAGFLSGTWPQLHWYVVSGYDAQKGKVYVTDTNNNNRWIPYGEFRSQWEWGVGRGAASSTYNANGIKTRTMVWVDRPPSPGGVGTLVKLRNRNWGRCLNLQSADRNGVKTNAWECVSHPDQEWKIEDAGNGFVKLRNKNWGRCLNLQSATKNGVETNAWECVPHPDQEWEIEKVG